MCSDTNLTQTLAPLWNPLQLQHARNTEEKKLQENNSHKELKNRSHLEQASLPFIMNQLNIKTQSPVTDAIPNYRTLRPFLFPPKTHRHAGPFILNSKNEAVRSKHLYQST